MSYIINKDKLTQKLTYYLKRKPTDVEQINALTDMNLVMQVLMDDIGDLFTRVTQLEKKVKDRI